MEGLTVEIREGELVGLVGPNGSGKTTLVNLLAGSVRPTRGTIHILGRNTTGLAPGMATESQFARRLAEDGCQVIVPVLIDRDDAWSGNPLLHRFTNQPHREWIYRQAYEMGRHIIGYEVQKVAAAVDWFVDQDASLPRQKPQPLGRIGVAGYGEGGLIGFYAAALDTRIDAALVSGYFGPREGVWAEPIYRNVFGLLREFGDADYHLARYAAL